MQAKHGRAGKHKRYQRAAVLALTVLLIILLAGRVLPVCAGKNVPAGASLKQAKPGQTLCFPLETAAWRVSDPYGWRKDPFTGEKAFHRGVDLACGEGTPVLAALDGVVTAARRGAAYGNYVRLTHGDGQETLYAHMQYLYVRAGEVVAAGQRLGTAGQTGRLCSGTHCCSAGRCTFCSISMQAGFCGWGCWQHSCMSGGTSGHILPCLGSFRSLKSPLPAFVCTPGAGK